MTTDISEKIIIEKEPEFSLEHWIKNEFEKDYNDQVKILDKLGLLEILSNAGEVESLKSTARNIRFRRRKRSLRK